MANNNNNEEKTHRNMSYAEGAARDNSLFTAWTTKWGIHVRPWFSMDKLRFCFVEVGKEGKGNSFDIYMDIVKYGFPCFKKWVFDIRSGRLERVLAAEAKAGEQYPKFYKYATGDKGTKLIGICNSRNGGYLINASVLKNGKRVAANVPVDLGDLLLLADNFTRAYEAREQELLNIRIEAEKRVASHYEDPDAQKGRAVIQEDTAPVEQPAQETAQTATSTAAQTAVNAQSVPAPAKAEGKGEKGGKEADVKNAAPVPVKVLLTALPEKLKGEFKFTGTETESGREIELYAANAVLRGEQKDLWGKLAETLRERKVTITFTAHSENGKMEIDKIA